MKRAVNGANGAFIQSRWQPPPKTQLSGMTNDEWGRGIVIYQKFSKKNVKAAIALETAMTHAIFF
jgi:hypothetical protein